MQVRWTALAAQDLNRITQRIRQDNPAAARQVAKILYDGGMSLETLPHRGRTGRIAGTRELIFGPFIVVYRVRADAVEILRIYSRRSGLALARKLLQTQESGIAWKNLPTPKWLRYGPPVNAPSAPAPSSDERCCG